MAGRRVSLRRALTVVTAIVGVLSLLVAGALVALTAALQQTSDSIVASVESIRLAEEAEVDLLLHARVQDGVVKRGLATGVRQKLAEAKRHVSAPEEAEALDRAALETQRYFDADKLGSPDTAALHESAYTALDEVVDKSVERSRQMHARGARWSEIADIIGIALAIVVTALAATVLVWLRANAFRPIFELAETMRRFGAGDFDARVKQSGAAELQAIGGQFNEMADVLAEQRAGRNASLAGVAHDLRNPLSALKLSFSFVREDQPLPPEDRLRHIIQIAERQISRLDRMVGDFLEIAKIDAGELTLETSIIDVEALVRRVVELLDPEGRGHPVRLSMPHEPVLLRCDPLRLEQVLINLVSNAMKYSPEERPITIGVEAHDGEVVVSVTDEGVGIAPEDQPRLFDAFRRLSGTKDAAPGVGLGLYVVKKIVDAHGGCIAIRSAPGRGATFTVTLPRHDDEPQEPSPAGNGEPAVVH